MRQLYTLLLALLAPLILLRLLFKSRSLSAYRERMGERLGRVARPPQPVAVWLHAVSVGEVMAALPLIRALLERHGERRVWVTTTTPTGSDQVRSALGDRVLHSYAPYDLPPALRRFLRRVQPEQVIIMETELWPNLFHLLGQRRIPLLIANARLSPRSFAGYSRLARAVADMLAQVDTVAAQSEADAERFRQLGARRVLSTGNLKFDLSLRTDLITAGQALRQQLQSERPVWAAISTHAGEEDAALTAHRQLLQRYPHACLILVPRHPQRFDDIARLVQQHGLQLQRRSTLDAESTEPLADVQVLLGDSMGEMPMYLAAADLAFVGGSLAPIGGHNIIEVAAVGLPVVFGPHMHNFEAARSLLLAHDAALQIEDESALPATVEWAFGQPEQARAAGARGRAAIDSNRGALTRLLQLIEDDRR